MLEIKCKLVGVSPILMNPMTETTLEELRTKVRAKKPTDRPAKEEAAEKLYKNEKGEIGVPALNLYSALMEAGRDVKNGKKGISTIESSSLPSFLWIDQEFLPFAKDEQEWLTDIRRGVLQKDKIAVCIVRPKFMKWSLNLTLQMDETICAESVARDVFKIAGNKIGLCDFRPSCRGPFGRFKIETWEIEKA